METAQSRPRAEKRSAVVGEMPGLEDALERLAGEMLRRALQLVDHVPADDLPPGAHPRDRAIDDRTQARIETRDRVMRLLAAVLAAYDNLLPLLNEFGELDGLCDDSPFLRGWLEQVEGVLALIDEQLRYSAVRDGGVGLSALRLQVARDAALVATATGGVSGSPCDGA